MARQGDAGRDQESMGAEGSAGEGDAERWGKYVAWVYCDFLWDVVDEAASALYNGGDSGEGRGWEGGEEEGRRLGRCPRCDLVRDEEWEDVGDEEEEVYELPG